MFWTLPCEACSPPWLMWCSHRLVALCFRIKLQKIGWEGEPQLRKKKYLLCFRRWLESQNAEEKDKKFLPSLRRANSQACQRRVGEKVSNMWRLSGLRQGRWHPERHACLRSHGEKPKREREREWIITKKNIIFYLKLFWSSSFRSCYCYFLVFSSISRWPLTFVQHVLMQSSWRFEA